MKKLIILFANTLSLNKMTDKIFTAELVEEQIKENGGITSFTVPDGFTIIGERAFEECLSLRKVILPESIIRIEKSAFSQCAYLKEINLPNSITFIGPYAFYMCYHLTSCRLPSNLISISEGIFRQCIQLSEVYLPDGLKSIEEHAFDSCSKLNAIDLPDSLTSLGKYCFAICNLKNVVLPEGISCLPHKCFWRGLDSNATITLKGNIDFPPDIEDIHYEGYNLFSDFLERGIVINFYQYPSLEFLFCETMSEVERNIIFRTLGGDEIPIKIPPNSDKFQYKELVMAQALPLIRALEKDQGIEESDIAIEEEVGVIYFIVKN